MVSLIVAFGRNREIGYKNKLLWYIPEDLKQFKSLTNGKTIIMGKNTFLSLPGLLPNRKHIVLTRDSGFKVEGVETFSSLETVLEKYNSANSEEIFIIGGAQVYSEAISKNLVDKLYLSAVDYGCLADAFLSEIDLNDWNLLEERHHIVSTTPEGKTIPSWTYRVYQNQTVNPLSLDMKI